MFKSIGHHTALDENGLEYIERNAPFRSTRKSPFLGSGYYFWDNHIELARFWGESQYKGRYVVCEMDFHVTEESFLDLVGSREDQIHFKNLINLYSNFEFGSDLSGEPIGKIITIFNKVAMRPGFKDFFPYKVIRAVDLYARSKFNSEWKDFGGIIGHGMYLSPQYILCLKSKDGKLCSNLRIVHTNQ